jgi:hypothetical protein
MLISYGYGMSASRNILIWLGCLTVGTVGGGAIYLKSLPHPMSVAIVPKVERSTGKKTVVPQYEKLDLLKKEDLEPVETEPVETVEPVEPEPVETSNVWYKGGTLHDATLKEWRQATYENQLATCADFISRMWIKKLLRPDIQRNVKSVDNIKVLAEKLVDEMNIASDGLSNYDKPEIFDNQKVDQMITFIIVDLEWMKELSQSQKREYRKRKSQ